MHSSIGYKRYLFKIESEAHTGNAMTHIRRFVTLKDIGARDEQNSTAVAAGGYLRVAAKTADEQFRGNHHI
jgi:hypothetical protein